MGSDDEGASLLKILACVTCPRDNIPEVNEQYETWPVDTMFFKFFREFEVYPKIREIFLKKTEYTHLAISSDDLVVNASDITQLLVDLTKVDYPILSGVCNIDESDLDMLNITPPGNVPSPAQARNYKDREYNFMKWSELNDIEPIIRVGFTGFPFIIIRRDIVQMVKFHTDASFLGQPEENGMSTDLVWCYDLDRFGIPIYADHTVNMLHKRYEGKSQVGERKPQIEFRAAGKHKDGKTL